MMAKEMASQVFYRKWRSQTLAEIVGQEPVTQTLSNALAGGRISHAYLFCGPRGTGKTSTARILAKAVNCLTNGNGEPCNTCEMCTAITETRAMDVIEIDAASNTGVDDIRSLREKVNYSPSQAKYKVYIIDEVHMLSNSASNALLKTLEEPPQHVIFILATTEAHKILPTIMSRCQRFDFRRIPLADSIARLTHICKEEGMSIEPEALTLIARSATGSLRDAINLLEKLATYYGSEIGLQQVQSILGITGDWRARELVKQIMNKDISAGIATIHGVNSDGLDLKQFNRELVEYLRSLLLIKTGSDTAVDLSADDIKELKNIAGSTSLEQILKATKLFGQLEIGFDNYPTLPLELALVDCAVDTDVKEKQSIVKEEKEYPQHREKDKPPPAKVYSEKPVGKPADVAPVTEEITPGLEVPDEPEPEAAAVEIEPVAVESEDFKPEPEPEPELVAAATVQPLADGSAIEQLRLNWKQVIEQAPQDTRKTTALAILRSAGITPVAIENNTVSLAFRYPLIKEQIEKAENQRIAEKILSNFLGFSCQVICVLEENNHLVKEALKMGAEIIDVEEK
ncbi:DNA polymerase III subunit gamma/tau [Chloroflexota bacterium]